VIDPKTGVALLSSALASRTPEHPSRCLRLATWHYPMALNLGKTDITVIVGQRNKTADGEHLLGQHIDREGSPVHVVATSPVLAAESEATLADITSKSGFLCYFTLLWSGDVVAGPS
jgi:hypothetical protein